MKNVSVFTTSNGVILGRKVENVVTGILLNGKPTEASFANLAVAEMKGELQTVTVGKHDSFGERLLTSGEKLSLNIVKLQMFEAKRQKDTYLIEQVFGDLRKK